MMKKKVLIIANHRRDRSPGQRFRFEQYLDFLEGRGFEFELSNIVSKKEDKILYGKGEWLQKALLALKAWWKRQRDVRRADKFDIIFIYREAFFTGSSHFERKFHESRAKVIFDFDDAIWLPNVSLHNRKLKHLKNPHKTSKLLEYADMVFAGNDYLADYAKNYNARVKVLPTTIDTSYHLPATKEKMQHEPIVIGWTGTQTTLRYLDLLKAPLKKLKLKYGEKLKLKVICDHEWHLDDLSVENVSWDRSNEISQLQSFDIGLMPLTDDEWSRGKCAFKALQYMAVGIPAILSPVGVNQKIIQEGDNGFLAQDDQDWYNILSKLIEDQALRRSVGARARNYVINNYSVEAQKQRYLEYFEEVLTL